MNILLRFREIKWGLNQYKFYFICFFRRDKQAFIIWFEKYVASKFQKVLSLSY